MAYCSNCGNKLADGSLFCGHCGHRVDNAASAAEGSKHSSSSSSSSFVDGLNDYIGNKGTVKLNWKDLFTDVFKKHTREEAEDIFICGTTRTTPKLSEVSDSWPKPWLYSRVLLGFIITYFLLYVCSVWFENPKAYPGLIIIGSFAVPFTTLVLFMEVNAFKNVSVYDVMKFFMVGGCASLVVTMFLYSLNLVDTDLSSTWGAMMVGIIEELGKLAIVYFLIKRLASCNYILTALLVGACVGAGFAAFESAGYVMSPMLEISHLAGQYGIGLPTDGMMEVATKIIYLRGVLAPGGHVAWAAISGAALVIAKGAGPLTSDVFKKSQFWKIFAIPVVLHGLWDAPIFREGYLKMTVLIVLVWIVVLIFINMGLDEAKRLKNMSDETL